MYQSPYCWVHTVGATEKSRERETGREFAQKADRDETWVHIVEVYDWLLRHVLCMAYIKTLFTHIVTTYTKICTCKLMTSVYGTIIITATICGKCISLYRLVGIACVKH